MTMVLDIQRRSRCQWWGILKRSAQKNVLVVGVQVLKAGGGAEEMTAVRKVREGFDTLFAKPCLFHAQHQCEYKPVIEQV